MRRLLLTLAAALVVVGMASLLLGEAPLGPHDFALAFGSPASVQGEIVWGLRAPRFACAALVGAALGLAGAVMQGLLRNPLADPGVLGVSAFAGLGAALMIVLGGAGVPGGVEAAALVGALLAGVILTLLAARFPEAEVLILFGIGLSSFGGALTALVFNLSPTPFTTQEVLNWMMGSVENRSWGDLATALGPMAIGAGLCAYAGRGLAMLTLGEETAQTSGLPMQRLRAAAVAGAAILAGASVALAGVIGFVGIAAPHLVRRAVGEDPERILLPAALAGAVLIGSADVVSRLVPSDQPLKLGVIAALFGAPLFGLAAWRTVRSWRG
jgi:iron complex transport system permease protein